jgi:aminoglycoside phosphotransferase (APT) family kinase protein
MQKRFMSTPKMNPDEIDINDSLAMRLIATQFPAWANLPIAKTNSAGTDNAIHRLGDDMAVRLPRLPRAAETVDKELHWLPRLGPHLPLAVPTPLVRGVPDDTFPFVWSIHRWLPGQDLADQPDVDLPDAALRLGRFVAALQRIDSTDGPSSFRGGPMSVLDAYVRAEIHDLGTQGTLDVDQATAVWDTALATPMWDGAPVWIHADLFPMNLLAQHRQLSAVIDFGGLGTGDPAVDMLPAWALLNAETRDLFRTEAGVDEDTWTRGRGWALALGLGAAHFYQVTNPALARNGRRLITETLAD